MKKYAWLIALLLFAANAFAETTPLDASIEKLQHERAKTEKKSSRCPDKSKLKGICSDLFQQTSAPDESPYQYEYEQKIYLAACADPGIDSPEIVQKKIKKMWSELEEDLTCDVPTFEVPGVVS